MSKTFLIFTSLILLSCASMTETVPGYSAGEIKSKDNKLKGSDRDEIIKILGKPVAEGLCFSGGKIGVGKEKYRLVYLKKDTARYSHALDMTSDKASVKCTIIDLDRVSKDSYTYKAIGGVMDQVDCNKSYGAIKSTRNPQKCKQIYKK